MRLGDASALFELLHVRPSLFSIQGAILRAAVGTSRANGNSRCQRTQKEACPKSIKSGAFEVYVTTAARPAHYVGNIILVEPCVLFWPYPSDGRLPPTSPSTALTPRPRPALISKLKWFMPSTIPTSKAGLTKKKKHNCIGCTRNIKKKKTKKNHLCSQDSLSVS